MRLLLVLLPLLLAPLTLPPASAACVAAGGSSACVAPSLGAVSWCVGYRVWGGGDLPYHSNAFCGPDVCPMVSVVDCIAVVLFLETADDKVREIIRIRPLP